LEEVEEASAILVVMVHKMVLWALLELFQMGHKLQVVVLEGRVEQHRALVVGALTVDLEVLL
jgi:hypothetical protein